MIHQFDISTVDPTAKLGVRTGGQLTVFQADTELGLSPQLTYPKKIVGKLLPSITLEQFLRFRTTPNVEVNFEGKPYKFSRLEGDGAFELSLIEP